MDVRTVETLLKARGWSQSELARRVGVSRQAVCLWFQSGGRAALHSPNFLRLGDALGVPVEQLARPLPCHGEDHARLRATLLWDGLYPDLDDFAIAVNKGDPRAIARLLEVYGLYATAKMIGDRVWSEFPKYSRYIHPARRRQLETLYRWHRSHRRHRRRRAG